jgi:hypothetical protein
LRRGPGRGLRDYRGHFAGPRIIRTVDKFPIGGEETAVFHKGVPDRFIAGVVILMIAFYRGKNDPAGMEGQKMTAVLAGFGDKIFVPQI